MIELLTADQLARQLNRSLRTLHRWRTETGTGPTALKIAGRWYYRRDETEQFIKSAWVAGVSRWPGLHDDPPECDAVQQRDEHAPPVLSAEVITRPPGVPVARPPEPDYSRPPGQDIWQGLGEPITTRFQ